MTGHGRLCCYCVCVCVSLIIQIFRVQTANGTVQDVTIPAPVQLKIVIRGEKSCQTDDLETDLQYRLHLNSPTELHYSNNGSVINYNGTSPETASANVCANDIMSNEQQQKSVNISPYHVFSENGLNGCVPDPLPWFQDTMKDGSQLGIIFLNLNSSIFDLFSKEHTCIIVDNNFPN